MGGGEPAAERRRGRGSSRPAQPDVVPAASISSSTRCRSRIAERYAVIVSYHYCHPTGGWLKGTKSITPEEFDAQLRVLTQNFVCTTMGELMNPAADLPETVAVVTFDDGFKDVVEHALPLLQRWRVPATVYCCSAPFVEAPCSTCIASTCCRRSWGSIDFAKRSRSCWRRGRPWPWSRARIPGCSASTRMTMSRRGVSSGC